MSVEQQIADLTAATTALVEAATENLTGLDTAVQEAQDWAEKPEDVPVTTGKFSAKHWAAKALASASSLATAVSTAVTKASDAAASALDALGSKNAAAASATGAATSAGLAAAIAGITKVYATKAAATADVATPALNSYILVPVDETRANRRVIYQKTGSSTLTFYTYLAGAPEIYVSNALNADGTLMFGASDSNDGLTPLTPKLTLAAVAAMATPFCKVFLAGGSIWYGENPNFTTMTGIEFDRYGQGPRPIITGRLLLTAATWTQPDSVTYPHIWKTTVALAANPPQATAIANGGSQIWCPAMYDERQYGATGRHLRIEDCGLARQFSGATRADCLAAVEANPGSFYTNITGSATVNPQTNGEAGNSIDIYVRLNDGTDPNGKPISFVDQRMLITIPADVKLRNIRFECTGSKDMINATYSVSSTPGVIEKSEFIEFALHGGVWTGGQFDDCKFFGQYTGQSKTGYGGGLHQFRGTGSQGMSLGFTARNIHMRNVGIALYSHGSGVYASDPSGEGYWDHKYAEYENILVEDCQNLFDINNPLKGVRLSNVRAYNVGMIGSVRSHTELRNSVIKLSETGGSGAIVDDRGPFTLTLINSEIHSPGGRYMLAGNAGGTAGQPATFMTLKLVDSVFYSAAPLADPGLAARRQLNLVLTGDLINSTVRGSYFGLLDGTWITGTITTNAKSILETMATSVTTMRAAYAGIDAATLIPVQKNTVTYTVQSSDISFPTATFGSRVVSYSGTPDTGSAGAAGSTATLTLNASITATAAGGSIRVVDAYGAGQHYIGRVLNKITGTTISVTPSPTGAFSNKSFAFGGFNKSFFGAETAAAISIDGTQIRFTTGRGALYAVGNTIRVQDVPGSPGKSYVRKISALSGDLATLDSAVPIRMNYGGWWQAGGFHNINGTPGGITTALPTCTVTREFPHFSMTYGVVLHDGLGTVPTTGLMSPGWLNGYNGSSPAYPINTFKDLAGNDVMSSANSPLIDIGTGKVSVGFGVADTDVLTVESTMYIPEYTIGENLAASALRSGRFLFKHDSVFAAQLGYQPR